MSELINLGEALPFATAATGYAAGWAAENSAVAQQALNRIGLIPSHRNTERTINSRRSWVQKAVAPLAVVGALAGFSAGEVFVAHETKIMDTPTLTEAVDLTYGTGQLGDGSDLQLRHIAAGAAQDKGLNVQLEVAHNSQNEQLSPAQVMQDRGYGSPVLPDTVTAAIDNAYSNSTAAETNALGAAKTRNAGVLIVDDNDSVGKPAQVVKYAREHGNLPVFAINRGPAHSQTAKELKTITKETHGKYWHISKHTASTAIANTVKQEITPEPVDHKSHDDQLLWGGMAVALTALSTGMYVESRRRWKPVRRVATAEAQGK